MPECEREGLTNLSATQQQHRVSKPRVNDSCLFFLIPHPTVHIRSPKQPTHASQNAIIGRNTLKTTLSLSSISVSLIASSLSLSLSLSLAP
ncbi:hypothetical protein VNO80_18481 [Phaseolus coccineus]|uniref:Uncharacterized protein n=1 Tax=Phaseolus coccineus TaxID=3886 RepID=A0AAN9MKI2_PHACN